MVYVVLAQMPDKKSWYITRCHCNNGNRHCHYNKAFGAIEYIGSITEKQYKEYSE